MSVKNENAVGNESVVLERPAAGGVYASLFEKINLNPVSELSALDIWQDAQAMTPCVQGICMAPVNGITGNLWQQHITAVTALPPDTAVTPEPLPLPELLLAALPRRRGVSRRMVFWRYAGLLGGIFLALAMLASWVNNQRLIRNVSDHLALYQHLTGTPAAPKLRAQQRLRADRALLDDWQRRGEPLRYRLGLYQGLRLVPPVEAAVSDWAPPPPPPPVIKKIIQGPKTIRLDSMSLFDSGKSALKAGSTKMLVHSLVGVKANRAYVRERPSGGISAGWPERCGENRNSAGAN